VPKQTLGESLPGVGTATHGLWWNWDEARRGMETAPVQFRPDSRLLVQPRGHSGRYVAHLVLAMIIAPPAQGQVVAFGPLQRLWDQDSATQRAEA